MAVTDICIWPTEGIITRYRTLANVGTREEWFTQTDPGRPVRQILCAKKKKVYCEFRDVCRLALGANKSWNVFFVSTAMSKSIKKMVGDFFFFFTVTWSFSWLFDQSVLLFFFVSFSLLFVVFSSFSLSLSIIIIMMERVTICQRRRRRHWDEERRIPTLNLSRRCFNASNSALYVNLLHAKWTTEGVRYNKELFKEVHILTIISSL